nr:copper resistance protein B [Tsuneonella mangrovi]
MRALLLAAVVSVATPAVAQEAAHTVGHADHPSMEEKAPDTSRADAHARHGAMDHSTMDMSAKTQGAMASGQMSKAAAPGPPSRAFDGPDHAADTVYGSDAMAPSRRELGPANGGWSGGTFMLDRLEARIGKGEDLYLWDAQAWHGSDTDKLWLKSEGEGAFQASVEKAEVQALWSHAIGPWFDLQTGVRYDFEPGSRAQAVLGVQGLAPYMFDVDAAAFLSDRGDLTARIEGEYDQRITQRFILQPRVELSLAAQDIPELRIGAGLASVEAGLRLRYEIVREFAPYVGVGYEAKLGRSADYARLAGERPDRVSLLVGVRAWF